MMIRYDSAHRVLIYLLISLFSFSFFYIIIIANSLVERGVKVTPAAVVQVVSKVKLVCFSFFVCRFSFSIIRYSLFVFPFSFFVF